MKIAIRQIIPDPDQPRKTFKEETLQELQASYNMLGLIQPLTVRPYDGKYMIVIGERRYRAAKLDKLEEIECIVRNDVDDRIAREMQFAENSQQENVPPLELAKAFKKHRVKYKISQHQLANIIGLGQDTIARYENLLCAAHNIQSYLQSGELDTSTAYEISTIKDKKRQTEFADLVVKEDLSRSEVRQLKSKIEAQKYRPVESIFTSHRQQQLEKPIAPLTETQQLIKAIEQPIKLIELKMAMEQVVIDIKSLDQDILSDLSSAQKADLDQFIAECVEALTTFCLQLRSTKLVEGEK